MSAEQARLPFLLCLASFLWGIAVIGAGQWAPVVAQARQSCSPSGQCQELRTTFTTLVATEGSRILLWLAVPLLASVVVTALLFLAGRGSQLAKTAVWVPLGLFWLVTFLTGFSIGVWFAPSVVVLTVATLIVNGRLQAPSAPKRAASY